MIGVILAILASISWVFACFIWRSQTNYFSAIQLNLIKNIIAVLIYSPILFTIDWILQIKFVCILFLSGLIGIALGDSLYIAALKRIGTRQTLTIEAFSPILANLLGSLLIGESLSLKVCLGAFIVSASLVVMANDGMSITTKKIKLKPGDYHGYIFAFTSVLCAVLAAILSRIVLKSTNFLPIQTTEIRLLAAVICLKPFVNLRHTNLKFNLAHKEKFKIILATILGTNIGILLQQTVFKILPIGLGWTLLSTSPIFSLLVARYEGEEINSKTIFIALMTISGVSIALL